MAEDENWFDLLQDPPNSKRQTDSPTTPLNVISDALKREVDTFMEEFSKLSRAMEKFNTQKQHKVRYDRFLYCRDARSFSKWAISVAYTLDSETLRDLGYGPLSEWNRLACSDMKIQQVWVDQRSPLNIYDLFPLFYSEVPGYKLGPWCQAVHNRTEISNHSLAYEFGISVEFMNAKWNEK